MNNSDNKTIDSYGSIPSYSAEPKSESPFSFSSPSASVAPSSPSGKTLSDVVSDFSVLSVQNILIMVLVILLILSILGINLLTITANFIQSFINILKPAIVLLLSALGFTTGELLNKSTEVVTEVAKGGIDVAGGAIQNVGDILITASQGNIPAASKADLENALKSGGTPRYYNPENVTPDNAANPIQNPISSNKVGWCLVGEYQGKRGCVEVGEQDKCLSGQIFPNQQMCLNPVVVNAIPPPVSTTLPKQ